MVAYIRTGKNEPVLCLLAPTFDGKFVPSLVLGPTSSGFGACSRPKTSSLVDRTTIGFWTFRGEAATAGIVTHSSKRYGGAGLSVLFL